MPSTGLGRTERFTEMAQRMGAALLYAPHGTSEALKNLGSLALPDGTLANGASLVSPGLVDDGAAVKLDGVDDYVDTGWGTRFNQFRNPSFELGSTEFWSASFPSWAVGLLNPSASPFAGSDGKYVGLIQAQKDATSTLRTATITTSGLIGSVKPGTTNRYSILANIVNNASEGVQVYVNWFTSASALISTGTPGPLSTGTGIVTLSTPALVAPAEASFAQFVIQFQSKVSGDTVDIRIDSALGEEASTVGTFFPKAAQLESGEAGWTGAANASPSQIGAFANGTSRTFAGVARADGAAAGDTLFGGSATGSVHPFLRVDSTTQVTLDIDASGGAAAVTWPGAWPAGINFWALVVNGPGGTAELFVNGESKGVKAITETFPTSPGSLKLGARGLTGDPLEGLALPFAVFETALNGFQVEELWRIVNGTSSRAAVTCEYPPDRVAVRIADPKTGATIARHAEDESRVENVISGLRKTGEMPGGHKELSYSLARDPRPDYPDLAPYLDVFVEQPGGEIIWGGRIDKTSESDGERQAVDVQAVGHQAALEDRKGIVAGFLNAELNAWGEPSAQRRVDLINAGYAPAAAQASVGFQDKGSAEQALVIDFTGTTASGSPTPYEGAELWFDGNGVPLGTLLFDQHGDTSTPWVKYGGLSSDDHQGATDLSTNYSGTAESLQQAVMATGLRLYAFLEAYYTGTFAGTLTNLQRYSNVRVLSQLASENLALQGEWPNVGFASGQMLRLAIPEFSYLEATEESVEDTGYVIPHAWFSDPGTLAAIVKELGKYELLDWFVMNGKLFEQRQPGSYGRKWQAYSGPSELKDSGIDGSNLYPWIKVSWQDVSGRTLTAGPLGSGAMVEDERLEITDPDHPAIKAGIDREEILALRGISTQERAIEAGERWLEDANELTHSGEATLSGYVMDDKGVLRPVGQVQPGDWIRFPDARDTSYRKIVVPDYLHDDKKCTVTLDAPSNAIESLLERYNAALIRVGLL